MRNRLIDQSCEVYTPGLSCGMIASGVRGDGVDFYDYSDKSVAVCVYCGVTTTTVGSSTFYLQEKAYCPRLDIDEIIEAYTISSEAKEEFVCPTPPPTENKLPCCVLCYMQKRLNQVVSGMALAYIPEEVSLERNAFIAYIANNNSTRSKIIRSGFLAAEQRIGTSDPALAYQYLTSVSDYIKLKSLNRRWLKAVNILHSQFVEGVINKNGVYLSQKKASFLNKKGYIDYGNFYSIEQLNAIKQEKSRYYLSLSLKEIKQIKASLYEEAANEQLIIIQQSVADLKRFASDHIISNDKINAILLERSVRMKHCSYHELKHIYKTLIEGRLAEISQQLEQTTTQLIVNKEQVEKNLSIISQCHKNLQTFMGNISEFQSSIAMISDLLKVTDKEASNEDAKNKLQGIMDRISTISMPFISLTEEIDPDKALDSRSYQMINSRLIELTKELHQHQSKIDTFANIYSSLSNIFYNFNLLVHYLSVDLITDCLEDSQRLLTNRLADDDLVLFDLFSKLNKKLLQLSVMFYDETDIKELSQLILSIKKEVSKKYASYSMEKQDDMSNFVFRYCELDSELMQSLAVRYNPCKSAKSLLNKIDELFNEVEHEAILTILEAMKLLLIQVINDDYEAEYLWRNKLYFNEYVSRVQLNLQVKLYKNQLDTVFNNVYLLPKENSSSLDKFIKHIHRNRVADAGGYSQH